MMTVGNEEAVEVLEEVLAQMDDIAAKLRGLRNARITAYCLADFEGRESGWLGEFERDILEQELEAAREESHDED